MSNAILQSKLKRLKISYKQEGSRTIIGKPTIDATTLIGFVILPLSIAFGLGIFMINNGFISGKIAAFIIFLLSIAILNFGRIGKKLGSNDAVKVLENNTLKMNNKTTDLKFNHKNISNFFYEIREIRDDIYEGNLYLKDTTQSKHQILGFDDCDEKLLKNDLEWFVNYFEEYLRLA